MRIKTNTFADFRRMKKVFENVPQKPALGWEADYAECVR
jgi:hypothetical protein